MQFESYFFTASCPQVSTEALEASGKDLTSCIRNPEQKATGAQAPIVHRLPRSLVSDLRFVLGDPNVQAEEVKRNDPGNVIGGGATDAQIGKAVDEAFRTGLFALSEIAFDTTHQRAVVSYSFWCGRLCGHGALLRLNKDGSKWKIGKRCADWIS